MKIIEIQVLKKMFRHGYIGDWHTSTDNIPKGFPKHVRGEVKKALKSLIRKAYVIQKPTSYGTEVSLNPDMIDEISEILKKYMEEKD